MIIHGDTTVFPAGDVITATSRPPAAHGLPFLDIDFKLRHPKDSMLGLRGCGVYAFGFDDRLVYIGSFLGKCKSRNPDPSKVMDPFIGDVAHERWWKHLSTCTLRGWRTGTERNNVLASVGLFGQAPPLPALFDAGAAFARAKGCQASKKRIRFAVKHWDELNHTVADAQQVLARFSITYVRIERGSVKGDVMSIMKGVKDAEDGLIKRLKPVVNDDTDEWIEPAQRMPMGEVGAHMRAALLEEEHLLNRVRPGFALPPV